MPSLHISYSRNPIHDGSLMPVQPWHSHKFGIGQRRRFSFKILFIIYKKRVGGVKALDHTVFYIYGRYPVNRGRNQVCVVKAYGVSGRNDFLVPVQLAISHSEMPFAYCSRGISLLLHHFRECRHRWVYQQGSISCKDFCVGIPPRIHSCEHCKTARS